MLCAPAPAQTDTFPLPVSRLGEADILSQKEAEKRTLVRCATRSEQEAGEAMNTVFVVSGAEILRNGWVTLGDVLRNVPGIRVSQPGNALEGETFLMEGSPGNSEVEILINDIPVRPSAARGMPLGSQLPIRQAERIEVLYGPGGASYGRGTAAGTVNIVLKETERPLFTQADLSFGREAYTSLDLFFGGKLGRDRNIFRFAVYGSSTSMDDRALFHDGEPAALYNPKRYLSQPSDSAAYLQAFHYEDELRSDSNKTAQALLSKTPHESRLFGFNMRWHGLHLSYNRFYRRDHSGLGLSPLAASMANPQSYVGERIETFSLGARRTRARGGFYYTLSGVFYKMDDRSTEEWVSPTVAAAYLRHLDPSGQFPPMRRAMELKRLDRDLFDRPRYLMAVSADFRQEVRWNRRLWNVLQLELGQATELRRLRPLARYSLSDAQGMGYFSNGSSFSGAVKGATYWEVDGLLAGWAQLHLKKKNWQLLAAWQPSIEVELSNNLRAAGSWSPAPGWQLRGGLMRSSRAPHSSTNTGNVEFVTDLTGATELRSPNNFHARPDNERVRSAEAGLRFTRLWFLSMDASAFWRRRERLVANGYFEEIAVAPGSNEASRGTYGWASDEGAFRSVRGFQAVVAGKPIPIEVLRKGGENPKPWASFKWENHLFFTHSKARTRMPFSQNTIDGAAGLPENILRLQTGFLFQKTTFLFRFNRESDAPTAEHFWKENWPRQHHRDLDKGRRTVDVVFRRAMSKNFQVYFFANNVFNRTFSGLDATGTPDDLFFNPQPGRQVRLGINYNMN